MAKQVADGGGQPGEVDWVGLTLSRRGAGDVGMVYGHLQSVEKDGCAEGADLVVGEGIHDLTKSLRDSGAVESGRELDARFGWRTLGWRSAAPVEVAERSAAHGWRLAAEPAGHDVMASPKHGSTLSVRDGYTPLPPPPPGGVFSNSFDAEELR